MLEKRIKCLLVEPYELPKVIEIENTLEEQQRLVGGYIECTYIKGDDEVVIVCNEEGKINGMKPNRDIGHDIIFGPFLIIADDYEINEFKSLTDNQISKYKTIFDINSIKRTEKKINSILSSKHLNNRER